VVEGGGQLVERPAHRHEVEPHALVVERLGGQRRLDPPGVAVAGLRRAAVGGQVVGGLEARHDAQQVRRHGRDGSSRERRGGGGGAR
jgi:hypothetical protein